MIERIQNTPELWKDALPDAGCFSHKYDRGHGVFIGGAEMTGATCLASYAATRMGLGLATILSPRAAYDVYRGYKPHIIVKPADQNDEKIEIIKALKPDVVVIGPGYGRKPDLKPLVLEVLSLPDIKVVLDADALSIFEDDGPALFERLNQNHVLTPHEGEFKRLFKFKGEKNEITQKAAELTGSVIVHKGQETLITVSNEKTVWNKADCPYLATAGTGDVLAGFIAGLIGQKLSPFKAAMAAVHMHGECGQKFGAGLVAEDLPDVLPTILKTYI